MNIVLIGAKASGKSTLGRELHRILDIPYREIDDLIEETYEKEFRREKTCKEIFDLTGEDAFRKREEHAVALLADTDWTIIITGGSTFMSARNRRVLRQNALVVYCTCSTDMLLERVNDQTTGSRGLSRSVFLKWYREDIALKDEVYAPFADITVDTGRLPLAEAALRARDMIAEEIGVRCTAANTFGSLVRVTTFGESHGPALGAVMDGLPAGIAISEADIQVELDKRKPGQSRVTTPRKEADRVSILSGVLNGQTTGTPLALIIYNKDSDSSKYEKIKHLFRPGHADFVFCKKYGIRDYRGGGRSSGRETVARVASGAIAKKVLAQRGAAFYGHAVQVGEVKAQHVDYGEIEKNIVRCADAQAAPRMIEAIETARAESDSVGGIVQLDIHGLPPGLGDPVFAKLNARLVHAIATIGAVKGIEIGAGFKMASMRGSIANDQMAEDGFASNNAGGIQGGISTGQPVILRIAVKPTPSIARQQQTLDINGNNAEISVKGRHDPCIVPRIIPVVENMAALVILDAWEIQSRLRPGWDRPRHKRAAGSPQIRIGDDSPPRR